MIKLIKKYFELGIKKLELETEVLQQMKLNNLLYQENLNNTIEWHNFKAIEQRVVNEENLKLLTSKSILDEQETCDLNILKRLKDELKF
jgi:hypothetical protein